MKIGHKLILGFFVVALLVGVVGYLAVNASQKALQESIGGSSVSLAVEVLDEIDRSIYNRIEEFQAYCKDLIVQEAVTKSNEEFEKLDDIQSYINEKDKEWTSVPKEEITPFMQELMNSKLSEELREKAKFYEEKHGHKVFGEIFTTNKYGANVAQTGRTTDYRQDDEEWWQRAREDGLYVADVEYDRSADVYSTDIGVRIDDENGNFIGVIKVVLNIEEVIHIIKKAEATIKYDTTQFKLLTKDKKIIYSTEEYGFLKDASDELLSAFEQEKEHVEYFVAKGDKPDEGDELFAHTNSKGYGDYKGLGWILIIEHKTEELFAPVAQLRTRILIITLAITAFAIVLGLFISKSISNPVSKLVIAAAEIGKGNLDTRIEIKSNDEIGELAASFNDMAGKLKEYYGHLKESHAHLEEEVQERTTELSSTNVKLKEEIAEHSSAQRTLNERIKELSCLFGLSKLVEQPDISLEQIFQKTVPLVRNAYQYPDVTCVKITFEGMQYKTDNFEKSELSQYARIDIRGDEAGAIEVYYLGESPESGQSPFLKEEGGLLDAVVEHLSRVAERRQAKGKLQLFRNLIDRSNDSIFVTEPQWGRFLDVNEKACDYLGYTREELLNMTVKDIDDSILGDSCWTERVNEIRKEGYMIFESLYKRRDGTTFPVEVNAAFIEQEKKSYLLAIVRDITERKQAEQALMESEEKYRTLLENVPQRVFLKDRNSVYVSCNENYAADLKIKSEEIAGRTDYEFFPKELAEKYKADDRRIMESGNTEEIDEEYIREGQETIVHTVKTPVKDEQGNITGVLGIFWGITELKQAEEKLKRAAEEWITTFNSITDLVSIQDKNFKLIRVNKAFADAFKMKPEEIIGKTCYELIHGTKEPPTFCPHRQTLDTKKPQRAEFFEPNLGVYIEASTSPIFDENGEVIASVHIAKNITERKQSEEVLRESEEKVRTLYDSSSDAIMLLDEKGFFDCNDATLRLFGCASREEFCSRHPADFSPPTQPCGTDSLTLSNQRIATAMQTGRNRFEWMHKKIDSDEAFLADVLLDVMELGGKKVLQARVYDITGRKKAEQRQARLMEEIESINKELKDFAYIISHDLKAPLRGIKTLTDWISADYAGKLGEQGKEQMDLLSGRIDRMRNLIDGVLQYSRVGRVKEEKTNVNLSELVPEVIDTVAPPENIAVTVEDKLPVVEGEETRIIQVFQNLLSNAVKYMDKPKGQIKVGCVEEDDFWKFSVADNGPGIEEKHFERIFQMFQTLSPRDEFESTGVGLTVVKKIVEMYGGRIWVESKVGEGSTFFFTLPSQKMGVKDAKHEANIVS